MHPRHAAAGEDDPRDPNRTYQRQKLRAREAVAWSVVLVDAVTGRAGAERTPGNPCAVELHPPWTVENLTAAAVEFQLVDARHAWAMLRRVRSMLS